LISFVNFVNYTIGMITENKNKENQSRSTTKEDQNQSSQSGIYLRDDHCDWGSSGMNEFTNEFSENN
jgi:hypothetical protein